eukprot:CAMPEP_0174836508 /NCGR_PEP_ID=MMETSP1114-20130205/6128_1 /TAXON_ID=312471 /ORGANISM="Neobodo designis, Strain CCAP 1951/1" /LENGTH=194 /DNA_ID=CAMNT_0016070509 /DNA_START=29 /DNA_END=613 /DNA_ORIENTATION=-
MGKPIAKRKAQTKAALKSGGADLSASTTPKLAHDLTKRERAKAVKETKAAKVAAKKKKAPTAAASSDNGVAAKAAAAVTSAASGLSKAFAPAQAAKQAAAVMRAQKKSAFVKHASARRNSTMTTTNLTDRERRAIFASELEQVQTVASHEAFQVDPLGALEAHLSATAEKLQPQTPDIGKKVVAVKHRAQKARA